MILQNNTRIQNRYLIVRLLGQGGFGAVYEAKDERLGHRVALKQLTLADPLAEKAFEREARILARLKHPALPKVSDYFAHSNDYFLVMEYIEGDDFKMLLEQRTAPFPVEQVLEWADQLLDALDYLHRQQPPVIHRDMKPGNIIKLTPAKIGPQSTPEQGGAGQIYLLDFGISKGGQPHTYQAASRGSIYAFSPRYASIEQIEGEGTDARSDLYSLGVTLHHLLSKQKPPKTISRAHAKLMNNPDPLRPVNELNPQVPVEVAQVLTSAVDFDPNLRPQSARAMRQMLKEAIARPPAPPTRPTSPTLALPWLVGVGILLLLVGLMAGSVLFGGASEPSTTASLTPQATGSLAEEAPATQLVVAPAATETPLPTDTPLPTPSNTPVPTERPLASEAPVPPTAELPTIVTRIAQKDGMVQVYVPEGDFEMGSADDDPDAEENEKPRHTVYLDAFWMDQTEVTNAMFAGFVEETGHQTGADKEGWALVWDGSNWNEIDGANWQHPQGPESDLNGLERHPVVQVSWNDAIAYCEWAERGLPTEAQWEKAAGGVLTEEGTRKWPWGNEPPNDRVANFNNNLGHTTAVGKYPAGASPYGALDMAGNVWEWVFDEYDSNYYNTSPRENPVGPAAHGTKVLRGGSFLDSSAVARVHSRIGDVADDRVMYDGIRCAQAFNP